MNLQARACHTSACPPIAFAVPASSNVAWFTPLAQTHDEHAIRHLWPSVL